MTFLPTLQNTNIYLTGFMGTGKSSVASCLHRDYHMELAEMDEQISRQAGCSIPQIFATQGECFFRDLETGLLKTLAAGKNRVVSCGGGTVLRKENIELMKSSGIIVLLTASPETIYQRVGSDTNRPVLEGHRSPQGILRLLEQRLPYYQKAADLVISTDGKEVSTIARELLEQVASLEKPV